MKSKKNLIISILAGTISCSYCLTASAGTFAEANLLKRGLLLHESENSSYKISEYNTNDDDNVNVLDLCRAKRAVLERYQVTSQNVTIEASGPWLSADGKTLTFPVKIKGNNLGVSSVTFDVKYNDWYFTFDKAYASSKGNIAYSEGSGVVQYTAPGSKNLTSEGIFVYLVFTAAEYVPEATYNIRLNDIHCAMLENDNARELTPEECSSSAKLSFKYGNASVVTDEPPVSLPETTSAAVTAVTTKTPETTTEVKPESPKQDSLHFSLDNAETVSDGRHLRIPVYMNANEKGIGSFSTTVKYDRNKFKLASVERGGFDGYGYVGGNSDNAVFNMNNGQNITQQSGIIAWLNFEINGEKDSKEYSFELTDIKASYYENWNQKQIDNIKNRSDVYKFRFSMEPAVTEPPVQTTVTVPSETEPPAETTAVPVTTATVIMTEPPVTTAGNSEPANIEDIERDIAALVNADRANNFLQDLSLHDGLCRAADKRALELAQSWSTERPDGGSLFALYKEFGVEVQGQSYVYCAKVTTAAEVMAGINRTKMSSFDDRYFNSIGVGHAYVPGSQYGHYWVVFVAKV